MKLKGTVLVDNVGTEELCGEWGLSVYIEYGDRKILLDTGDSPLFAENAVKLGKKIEDVEFTVLSHAHYDHSNGYPAFFELNDKAPLYLQEGTLENLYSLYEEGAAPEYAGVPQGMLEKNKDRIVYTKGIYEICEGVYTVPHSTPGLEKIGEREKMYLKVGDEMIFDNFYHEQSLVFEVEDGLVVYNSCSHGGVVTIINEVRATFPGKNIHAYIGGFHLFNKTDEEVRAVADEIRNAGVKCMYTGHCTGERAYKILDEELPGIMNKLQCGLVMEF